MRSQSEDDRLTALALSARAGDRASLEELVTETQRDVWRFVAHRAGVRVADDLAQETYLRALKGIRRFSGRSSVRVWLLSIARRVVVDNVRLERSRPRTDAGDDWVDAADRAQVTGHAAGFEDVVGVNLVLRGLDEDRREALLLTQVLGLSYQEAAGVCGCAVGTIRSRVARAREDLLAADDHPSEGTG